MRRTTLLSLLLTFFAAIGYAQETGCFKLGPDDEVALETYHALDKYDAFFVGEFHGIQATPEIKLALIKYANQHNGVTDVFMEIGLSAAFLFNAYLESGDTTLITDPPLPTIYRNHGVNFWKQLYTYNKTLEHKLIIRGMDFERAEFLKVLKMLMPMGKEKPSEISGVLSYIDTVNLNRISNSDDIQDSLYTVIRNDMKQHNSTYEQYYGDKFKTVASIMYNVNSFNKFNSRNKTMYRNMEQQIEDDGIKKLITFNGAAHAWKDKGCLCGDLLRGAAFKNKLVDITFVCKNCYDYNGSFSHPGGRIWELEQSFNKVKEMDTEYDKYFNNGCRYTLMPASLSDKKNVRINTDYIILIKDQPRF